MAAGDGNRHAGQDLAGRRPSRAAYRSRTGTKSRNTCRRFEKGVFACSSWCVNSSGCIDKHRGPIYTALQQSEWARQASLCYRSPPERQHAFQSWPLLRRGFFYALQASTRPGPPAALATWGCHAVTDGFIILGVLAPATTLIQSSRPKSLTMAAGMFILQCNIA